MNHGEQREFMVHQFELACAKGDLKKVEEIVNNNSYILNCFDNPDDSWLV